MSTYTDNYVNPLEMDVWSLDPNDSKGMVREKGEFMLGLCEQCIGCLLYTSGLIEKVGMFAMEKKAISVDQVKENFSINGEQAESVIKQLETDVYKRQQPE